MTCFKLININQKGMYLDQFCLRNTVLLFIFIFLVKKQNKIHNAISKYDVTSYQHCKCDHSIKNKDKTLKFGMYVGCIDFTHISSSFFNIFENFDFIVI